MLGIQALGVVSVIAWVAVTMTIVFFFIKKTVGLRVSRQEEIAGLDIEEHGLVSSYADFMPMMDASAVAPDTMMPGKTPIQQAVPVELVSVQKEPVASDVKITKVAIVTKPVSYTHLSAAENLVYR